MDTTAVITVALTAAAAGISAGLAISVILLGRALATWRKRKP